MVVFVSNYINHHQLPFCKAMLQETGGDFVFVETEKLSEERAKMGWGVTEPLSFVKQYQTEKAECDRLLMEAEHVIFGGAEDEEMIQPRLLAGKPTIRYSERLYKEGQWKFISPKGLKQKYHDHGRFRKNPAYLLCAGAFVAGDYSLVRAYPGKKFKWGYFPEVIHYDDLWAEKQKNREAVLQEYGIALSKEQPLLLWTGRQIDWKHPEQVLYLASMLRDDEVPFHLIMVGDGEEHEKLLHFAEKEKLEKQVTFLPFMKPEEVRRLMLAADFYFMTSDAREGWGAVVNEAMNSGCVTVGGSTVGAVPYLIHDQITGIVYDGKKPDTMSLVLVTSKVWSDVAARREMGEKAYRTMRKYWNPEYAASVLVKWMNSGYEEIPEKGPLSRAPRLWPGEGLDYTRRHMPKEERRLRKKAF
ncbi:MAG: glycosyltransferase family 4 protein [Lachnospiraceae bacterium]|nr:glycosyltransferase family 4 protein [Lachnospiraceae bacterium]